MFVRAVAKKIPTRKMRACRNMIVPTGGIGRRRRGVWRTRAGCEEYVWDGDDVSTRNSIGPEV